VGWGGVNPKHIRTKKLRVWLFWKSIRCLSQFFV
jgi:hypothetical protein